MQGNKAMANKEYELAINKYTEAIKVLPTNAIYYANRAACELELKNYRRCIEDCSKALTINPK
ncbi:tetratricopeptide repeat protein, partial [Roseburia hominis]|nr:tetratricopeptide repeat protein [Roseburia hominis]